MSCLDFQGQKSRLWTNVKVVRGEWSFVAFINLRIQYSILLSFLFYFIVLHVFHSNVYIKNKIWNKYKNTVKMYDEELAS